MPDRIWQDLAEKGRSAFLGRRPNWESLSCLSLSQYYLSTLRRRPSDTTMASLYHTPRPTPPMTSTFTNRKQDDYQYPVASTSMGVYHYQGHQQQQRPTLPPIAHLERNLPPCKLQLFYCYAWTVWLVATITSNALHAPTRLVWVVTKHSCNSVDSVFLLRSLDASDFS